MKLLLIGAGGAAGSVLRYIVSGWGQSLAPRNFPLGTLIVNVAGCFLIGLLQILLTGPFKVRLEYRQGLILGVLGGFTTFSAFGWETFSLANDRSYGRAMLNIVLSISLGLAAVWAGSRLAEKWHGV